jgi:hypothetical protein
MRRRPAHARAVRRFAAAARGTLPVRTYPANRFLAVLGIFEAAISRQLTDEFKAWAPRLVSYLIQRAVRQLPENQRKRREEEWRSHVDEIPGKVGKLTEALDCLRPGFAGKEGRNPLLLRVLHHFAKQG